MKLGIESDTWGSEMRIVFATGNQNKLKEAKEYLEPLGHNVEQLLVAGKAPDFIEPQIEDLQQVTLSKLEQAIAMMPKSELSSCAILVEDSGLFIDSLKGFPGVYSSYAYKTIGPRGILRFMGQTKLRGCEYRAVSILFMQGKKISKTGICRCEISLEITGNGGFGYDPIFIPEVSDGRTFSQMSESEKSSMSHRGKSLKALSEAISSPSM